MGNESADPDSICGAMSLAYVLFMEKNGTKKLGSK